MLLFQYKIKARCCFSQTLGHICFPSAEWYFFIWDYKESYKDCLSICIIMTWKVPPSAAMQTQHVGKFIHQALSMIPRTFGINRLFYFDRSVATTRPWLNAMPAIPCQ